jgi:hypothetical protein
MNVDTTTVRLLGVAQLTVFIASLISERLLETSVGTGTISDILTGVSDNIAQIRVSNLIALGNSLAIIVLGVLFYIVFNREYQTVALVALAFFLAEAITLAVSKIGTYALIPLSQEFVEVGAPASPNFQTLGDFLYHGVYRFGYQIHMLFFCMGGILWYYLLLKSGYVPSALSIWGLVAVCLLTIPTLLDLYNPESKSVLMILALPYAPFELVLGLWLVLKGFN